ncbi:MAG: MFS transporter, partial [Actinomycetota bacterium]
MTRAGSDSATGVRGYLAKLRLFSRNARLYLLHIFGMDVIHGTWEVLFNLYLLEVGFGIGFVGLRLAVQGVATTVFAVPAGRLADRVDRKWGFIVGDGMGAMMAIVQITAVAPGMILAASAVQAAFMALHHVTEAPFMAENSEPPERIHLFSVGAGFRTLAAMAGALVAGFLPGWLVEARGLDHVAGFRWAAYSGIGWWFLSLVPAMAMRRYVSAEVAAARAEPTIRAGLFGGIRSPRVITRFVVIGALLALGGGFVLRLTNVFFSEEVHAHEHEIGVTFAAGSLFLAMGAFLAPLIVERFGKVRSIWLTRFAAIPFILVIGFAPDLATPERVVSLAGAAFILRTALFNTSGPVWEAYTMEALHPSERATFTGLDALVGGALAAAGSYIGAG